MSDYNHNYMFNVSLHFYFFEHSFDIKYSNPTPICLMLFNILTKLENQKKLTREIQLTWQQSIIMR